MKVYFDIQHLYYIPQYLPVMTELEAKGVNCHFILHQQTLLNDVLIDFVNQHQLNHLWVADKEAARQLYLQDKPEWIIFGNAIEHLQEINQYSKTALMQHGIGPKSCYYEVSKSDFGYRFVEGEHRLKRLQAMFPSKTFINTGYAKLDPIINGSIEKLNLAELGLDPHKKTLLYAPTFYPSSIECLPNDFPAQLQQYNIIVKPHFFSLIKKGYQKQRQRFSEWKKYPNIYIATVSEVSILPFMDCADLMFSDASSTLFEFTALNKPAIWCDFYKVRWAYRGIFKWRLKKRLDPDLEYFSKVAQQVKNTQALYQQIETQLQIPTLKENDRLQMTELLTGKVDGLSSKRIVDYILTEEGL